MCEDDNQVAFLSTISVFRSQHVDVHNRSEPVAGDDGTSEEKTQTDGDRSAPVDAESTRSRHQHQVAKPHLTFSIYLTLPKCRLLSEVGYETMQTFFYLHLLSVAGNTWFKCCLSGPLSRYFLVGHGISAFYISFY